MSIFNSLGSNYDFGFVIRSLFAKGTVGDKLKLEKFLEDKYGGKVVLTYKGREALRLALRASNLKNATVGICGFTCFAVYEAIAKEGYKVEYLDIEKDFLNFSIETLELAFKKNPELKIIFVQNTLGYPCDIESISKFCKDKGIILVEDLAHSIGSKYSNGKEAGTVGDFVMLSFSQDKMIDKVSGGALIIRNSEYKNFNLELKDVDRKQVVKDWMYPIITFKIRKTYDLGIGKVLHGISKAINILSKPMEYLDYDNIHSLPIKNCREIYSQFKSLEKNLLHRKKIALIYKKILNK